MCFIALRNVQWQFKGFKCLHFEHVCKKYWWTSNILWTMAWKINKFKALYISRDHFCMHPANERRRYIVTSSLIGWAHAQNDHCMSSLVILMCFPNLHAVHSHNIDVCPICHHAAMISLGMWPKGGRPALDESSPVIINRPIQSEKSCSSCEDFFMTIISEILSNFHDDERKSLSWILTHNSCI